jgi:SAM-dependent methyltransferase
VDLSSAVDACWRTNGPHENLSLVQANIERIPFAPGSFDRVFCYGVLQHTPDPRKSFNCLVSFLRKGGKISIDSYIKSRLFTRWTSKYLWRPITTRISPTTLRKIVEYYVPKWLPVDTALSRIPVIGSALVGIIPCWNYTGMLPLEAEEILSWAILDTYDALASRYDKPQTLQAIHEWFSEAALSDVQVEVGSNGIVGNGCRV